MMLAAEFEVVVATRYRNQRKHQRGEESSDTTERTLHQVIQQGDRTDRRQGLREQNAKAREAEHFCAQRLNPEPERRLVDGDKSNGVQRIEEERVQILSHAQDRRGVEGVR